MTFRARLADYCMSRPKTVTWLMVGVCLAIIVAVVVPTFVNVPVLNPLVVDTDPENMLAHDEPIRVNHRNMKKRFNLHDIAVVGIVNDEHPDGVFNPQTLNNIYELTEFAKSLRWEEEGKTVGVVEVDLISPSSVDNIEQGGLGVVRFDWLMPEPPKTPEEARAIGDKAARIPFLNGTLVSEDRKSIALYLPLTSKDISNEIYNQLNEKIATFEGSEKYHLTGLPMAEDVFGVEMFVQMGISGPLSMVLIFVLLLIFFRKVTLILGPMIISQVAVIITMGGLVVAGYPIHILASLIPIFIMPIAVLDAVHILSEFFDRYQLTRDRRQTMKEIIEELFTPMLYTSLTTSVGFASLFFTPIPPVQVFGIFVAVGIMSAWFVTITFMPAYVMFISEEKLESFGAKFAKDDPEGENVPGVMASLLRWMGRFTYERAKLIVAAALIVLVIAGYGISKIVVNDNPMKWFGEDHPIRVADDEMNKHFGGTYMAYLTLSAEEESYDGAGLYQAFASAAQKRASELQGDNPEAASAFEGLVKLAKQASESATSTPDMFAALDELVTAKRGSETGDVWDEIDLFVDEQRQVGQLFKRPDLLKYIEKLQEHVAAEAVVGKSNSLVDIVKTVHRDLLLGKEEEFRVPDDRNAVAQCLITFQSSHRAHDLWHFVTPDYRSANIWMQLKSGDNVHMSNVARLVNKFIVDNPPPADVEIKWFGLTYLNVVWQDKMVFGMLQAFAGSFLVVFLLMAWLFRSSLWGFLAMLPLTATIVTIYGVVGLIGKSYDMPVAVLSSLSLGLAVDFAIHFLVRGRGYKSADNTWKEASIKVFGQPARAIARNIIVVATGFTPLLFAPLTPYVTVGTLLATILLLSGVATLVLMPALVTVLEKPLFSRLDRGIKQGNPFGLCLVTGLCIGGLVVISLNQYSVVELPKAFGIGAGVAAAITVAVFVVWGRKAGQDLK